MTAEQNEIIECLYRAHYKRLLAIAYKHSHNWEVAHELVQETFAVACAKIELLATHDNQVGWLVQTVKYIAYNDGRKRAQYAKLFLSLDSLFAGMEPSKEDELHYERMLEGTFSKEDLHLIRRIVIEKATYKDVAEELNIGVWAAQKRMQRLLKRLKKEFE